MTVHEGKEVTGSAQYCAINKSPYGQTSKQVMREKRLQV